MTPRAEIWISFWAIIAIEFPPRELEVFYSEFVQKRGMSDAQCVVFAHFKDSGDGGRKGVKLCKLDSNTVVHNISQ